MRTAEGSSRVESRGLEDSGTGRKQRELANSFTFESLKFGALLEQFEKWRVEMCRRDFWLCCWNVSQSRTLINNESSSGFDGTAVFNNTKLSSINLLRFAVPASCGLVVVDSSIVITTQRLPPAASNQQHSQQPSTATKQQQQCS